MNEYFFIDQISRLVKLKASQNTLILNFGFGKCGSTSLQSLILPFLPLSNYTYEGRHYKLVINSSDNVDKVKPVKIEETLSNYIYDSGKLINKLSRIFKGHTNRVACLSDELLPSNPALVYKLIHLIQKSFSKLKILYLFSIRDVVPMVKSGFSHACLQHLELKGYAYSINDVIFDTFNDAAKEGFTHESLFSVGAKRPIIIESYYLAKMIEDLEVNNSDTYIINVNNLFTNKQIWFEILLNITKNFEESENIATQLVKFMRQLSPMNKKTSLGNSKIDEKERSLNTKNSKKLDDVDAVNKEKYCKLGHYWG